MSIKPVTIIDGSSGLLTATVATYYTCRSNESLIVSKLSFTNIGATTTVTGYIVPSGETAATKYQFIDAKSIAGSKTWSCPDIEGQILEGGDTIQLLAADASRIAVIGSGIEVV